ncbi:MAG: MBL fold metallo-hydrolase [Treponema sp.]|nr:MBL fold metallo-hydrolase [Treponema sp.]
MKLLYLGTGASEGIPAVFCSCPVCQEARRKKGRNIRTRSQSLLDGKVLFDFPPDSFMHYLASGFEANLPAVRRLFITHSHMDHFYPDELDMRRTPFVASEPVETLHIYGNRTVEQKLLMHIESPDRKPCNEFHYAQPFEPIEFEGYRITPLLALHAREEECLFYAAEHEGKAMLYAHDTGFFPEPDWVYFAKANLHFDLVSLDCTVGVNRDGGNHMGLPDCIDVRKKFVSMNAAGEKTIFVLNHFSHNGGLNYDELCKAAESEGFVIAYDGMEVEF